MRGTVAALGLVAGLLATPQRALLAQGALDAGRLRDGVSYEAVLSDEAWQQLTPLPMLQFRPVNGAPPSARTEARIGYDDRSIWVAFRSATGGGPLLDGSLTRDRSGASDVVTVLFDTFNDSENAVAFSTTPSGVPIDFTIARDGSSRDDSWNQFWDIRTEVRDGVWHATFRIPLTSIRFPAGQAEVVMGVIATRFAPGRQELDAFPALRIDLPNANERPSAAGKVRFRDLRSRVPIYVTPYVLAGNVATARRDIAPGSPWRRPDSSFAQIGGDVKIALSSNLTLDLTANTDFAQVEVDDEQFNTSRFTLFFPEKRQFFLERAGTFALPIGSQDDNALFFNSRVIGLTDEGRPVRLYGGARLVGRVGDWDVGLLSMAAESPTGNGSEQLSIARLRRRIFNSQSTVGATLASRAGNSSRPGVDAAVDGRIRAVADHFVGFQLAQSVDADDRPSDDNRMIRLLIERPSSIFSKGFAYHAALKWSGEDFAPRLGFQPRRDYRHENLNVRYGFEGTGRLPWRMLQPSLTTSRYVNQSDGEVETHFRAAYLNADFRNGWNGWIGLNSSEELLRGALPLSREVRVPAGRYRFQSVNITANPPAGKNHTLGAFVSFGELYDGTITTLGVFPSVTLSRHLSLGGSVQRTRIRFDDRNEAIDADLARIRVTFAADAKFSGQAFLQYNRGGRVASGNVRLRYRFSEGHDLFLVVNERNNLELDRVEPGEVPLPRVAERSIVLKYSRPFIR
jgi:hypothetical protein